MKIRNGDALRFFGFALILMLSLSACGKGCSKLKGGGGAVQKSSLELIPAESNLLIGVDWKKIEASPLGAKIKADIPPEAASLAQNIEGVVVGGNLKGIDKSQADFVAVISGKLDQAQVLTQLEAEAKKQGVTLASEEYEGIKIYGMPKDQEIGLAFLEGHAVIGSKGGIKKSIDLTKKKGESVEKNKELMELVKGIDKNKMLWAVGSIPPGMIPAAGASGAPGNPMASLAGLKALDLAIDYPDSLLIDLGVLTASKDSAQQLMTMANSYKTLFGTGLAMKDPTLGKVLSSLTIDAKEDRVILSLKLDKATVDELAKKAAEKQPALPGSTAPAMGEPAPGVPVAPAPAPIAPPALPPGGAPAAVPQYP